jgi:AcrR family transcriptional regulator
MPRMTRTESMAVTRQKLLEAALHVFSSDGFSKATVERIASAAGFSRGAFYAHFASKEDILLAVVETQSDDVTPVFLKRIEEANDPEAAIEAVVRLLGERGRSQGLALAVMDALGDEQRRGELGGRYAHLVTSNWRTIGEALRRFFPGGTLPCEPDEIVAILVALTYSPVVGGATNYQTSRLAGITLRALMGHSPPN